MHIYEPGLAGMSYFLLLTMTKTFAILALTLVPWVVTIDPGEDPTITCDKMDVHSSISVEYSNHQVANLTTALSATNDITEEILEETFTKCETILKDRDALEIRLAEQGRVVKGSERKSDLSLLRMRKFDPLVHTIESAGLAFDYASDQLCNRFNLSRDDVDKSLPDIALNGEVSSRARDSCNGATVNAQCDANSRYRRADAQCNNLRNPRWGSAMACQRRIRPAYYIRNSEFRVSVTGKPLPDPRTLSLNLHFHYNRPTNYVTHMYMFFGQLLDHDLTLTPQSTTVDNQAIECCPPATETHPQCRPILLSENDPFYSQFGITCINFVRSAICPTCTLGSRQLMNQVTSVIDASFVYGNAENETASLRMNDGTGRLRIQTSNFGDLLPRSQDPANDQCSFPDTNDICFEAGDPRANQHTVLASLHTIFMREHNRIATQLRQINPQWNDERLFQETRRIVAAVVQIITYKEYLPITLGSDRMSYFKLWTGRWTSYDSRTDPTMMIEFTTAAFRFGHSLINSVVANRPLNATNGRRLLRNEFFQPFDLYRGFIGPLVRGASNSPAQWFDRHLVPDVTNFLYRVRGNQTGMDLAAININRGRDHGAPTYVDTVYYCSNREINVRTFDDLVRYQLMGSEQARALRANYRYVEDVDLWPGILMETPNEEAVVGPTAACIIGLQFYNLKFGDRFYVEHSNQAGSFTYQQLRELREMTLSQILCLNTEITQLSMNAMLFNSRNNPYINCRYVTGVDLSYWRE